MKKLLLPLLMFLLTLNAVSCGKDDEDAGGNVTIRGSGSAD